MSTVAALDYQPFAGLTGSDYLDQGFERLRAETEHYLEPAEIDTLLKTAIYGAHAHEGQVRQSGEPYFTHPLAVALILANQRFDLPVLQAALLHDVLEDTPVTKPQMAEVFGDEVTTMVDGVSKLERLKNQGPKEVQAESFRKMLVATTDDPRVIIIKLADRLHNMRTLAALRPDKRIRKAKETMDVYASIAGRLGLFYFRMQLEDLAFSYLHPWRYAVLKKHYTERYNKSHVSDLVRRELMPKFQELGISATINKRQRHMWGLYQRMLRKQTFAEACRTVPLRIITDTEDNCYRILGLVHASYRPIMGKFEDFIAAPKSNGYRSLHTSVLMKPREVLNIQIRTREMHALAETGIIAVWHQHIKNRDIRKEQHTIAAEKYMRDWLYRLKEVQNITHDPLEFYDAIKNELTSGDMHVYTPKGEVIDLPKGATPVDFAYAIHTEVGDHCIAAKVNGQNYPIFKPLEMAQTVEIQTSKEAHPYAGWLQFVVTAKARAGVNHHLRTLEKQEAQQLGRSLLSKAFLGIGGKAAEMNAAVEHYCDSTNTNLAELLDAIAHGKKQAGLIASSLLGKHLPENVAEEETLLVTSAMESGVTMGQCCHPLPFEAIVGHLEPDVGIVIHRKQCLMTEITDSQDWVTADWSPEVGGSFVALLSMSVIDKPRMLSAITQVIASTDSNIEDVKLEPSLQRENIRVIKCWIDVKNRDHLAKVIRGLRNIDGIIRITRS